MRDEEWGEEVDMLNVVCPDCGFSFCHIHTNADGGLSCPCCGELESRRKIAALTAERDELREALEELVLRCDGEAGVRADGSNIQTMRAHYVLDQEE